MDKIEDTPFLVCENIGKIFKSNVAVFDVNLRIDKGEIVALLGRNGAGKTTLLRMILGVTDPTTGRSSVRGLDSWPNGEAARRCVGFVPERPGFPRGMTGRELLNFVSHFYSGWDMAYAEALAEKFKIPLRERLGRMSKGTLNQVAFIAAIAHRPSVLVLDEPFGCLDPVARFHWREELRRLQTESSMACLFSTHLLEDVTDFCSRAIILNRGEILVDEPLSILCCGLYLISKEAEFSADEIPIQSGVRLVCKLAKGVVLSLNAACAPSVIQSLESHQFQCTSIDLARLFREVSA